MEDNWGYKIRELREKRGLIAAELAVKAGLSQAHISRIESGKLQSPTLETLEALSHGLGMTVGDLTKYIRGGTVNVREEMPEEILERLRLASPVAVPVYREFSVHAGGAKDVLDHVFVSRAKAGNRKLEAYPVKGKCLEPKVAEGDLVVIDRDAEINQGDMVICLFNGLMHCGYLRRYDGELYIENGEGRVKLEEVQVAAKIVARTTEF
jgi:transcriptional regulator with XRE-family HTH domain